MDFESGGLVPKNPNYDFRIERGERIFSFSQYSKLFGKKVNDETPIKIDLTSNLNEVVDKLRLVHMALLELNLRLFEKANEYESCATTRDQICELGIGKELRETLIKAKISQPKDLLK